MGSWTSTTLVSTAPLTRCAQLCDDYAYSTPAYSCYGCCYDDYCTAVTTICVIMGTKSEGQEDEVTPEHQTQTREQQTAIQKSYVFLHIMLRYTYVLMSRLHNKTLSLVCPTSVNSMQRIYLRRF